MAIISRLKGVIESVGFVDRLQHVTMGPDTGTIWRFDNESYCVNALFKDGTVQTAGQAFHSPDIAKLAAEDMATGLAYCPFNRNKITHFLICSRRERELFRIANKIANKKED